MASKKTHSPSRSELRTRHRRRTIISLAVILGIAVAFALWSHWAARIAGNQLAAWSDHFRVRNTVVLGNNVVPLNQILDLAAVKTKVSLFNIPVNAVKTRIQQHPWIRYAYVRRRFPDTIEIRIVEREPVAILRGEGTFLITADSVAVLPLKPNWDWNYPILTPPHSVTLRDGKKVTDPQALALLHEALIVHRVSQQAWRNLSELYYSNGQMHASLSQPAVDVLLGQGVTELAWSGALKLMSGTYQADLRNNPRLDLRFPGKIVVSDNSRNSAVQGRG